MSELELREVSVRYGNIVGTEKVSLRLASGRAAALIGANGAGKSSTLKAIMGMAAYPNGDILLDGASLKQLKPFQVVQKGVSLSPEGRRVFFAMTVLENLRVGAYSRGREEIEPDLERVFGHFPRLRERSHQRAGSLSGGEQQMLAIGRALMSRPAVLLLDEPSLGLAPVVVERIGEALQQLREAEGLSILLAEQNAAWALSIADEALIIELGRVTMSGPAAQLAENPEIRKAYLGI